MRLRKLGKTAVLTVIFSAALSSPVLVRGSRAGTQAGEPTTAPAQPTSAQPDTPDTTSSAAAIEKRAVAAVASGDYAAALPLLRRMLDFYKDDARKLKAVKEQISVCEKQLNSGNGEGTLTPEQRKPIPAPKPGEVLTFESIKDLGNFEYDPEKGGGIPPDVKALSGKPIKLHGFMITMDQAESITNFALVPSLFGCCFGQPPQIQHTVIVHLPKGKAIGYYPDELLIEGELKVEEKKEDGFIVSVFELSATSVKPAGR